MYEIIETKNFIFLLSTANLAITVSCIGGGKVNLLPTVNLSQSSITEQLQQKVYAQKDPTGILAESYLIALKDEHRNHDLNLFLSAALEKALYPKYSRDYLATWAGKVENDIVFLPNTIDKNIDFEFISSVVTAVKKLVIKDVVEDSRRRLQHTASIINKHKK